MQPKPPLCTQHHKQPFHGVHTLTSETSGGADCPLTSLQIWYDRLSHKNTTNKPSDFITCHLLHVLKKSWANLLWENLKSCDLTDISGFSERRGSYVLYPQIPPERGEQSQQLRLHGFKQYFTTVPCRKTAITLSAKIDMKSQISAPPEVNESSTVAFSTSKLSPIRLEFIF